MTGDTELDAALTAYRAAKTPELVRLLETAAAFGTSEEADEAATTLRVIERINTTADTRRTFFINRLEQATARLNNHTNRIGDES